MDDLESGYGKIYSEVIEKQRDHERAFVNFYGTYEEGANAYRMLRRDNKNNPVKTIFNSRVGETARAANTLADVWLRMATAADPYISAERLGLNNFGQKINDFELYGTEKLLSRQLEILKFKKEFRKTLLSGAMFGAMVVEEPWLRDKRVGLEGTGFFMRPLIQTFFNPYVSDIDFSEYIGFVDYISEANLMWLAKSSPNLWDITRVRQAIADFKDGSRTYDTDTWTRINIRKQRAGYNVADFKLPEVITYHGRLDTDNELLIRIWEELGRTWDINDTDWTVRAIGRKVVSVFPTPYGTWHSIVKTAVHNQFELEPIGYGIAQHGRIYQKELDGMQSMLNNLLLMSALNMWKMGRYGGLRQGNIPLQPLGIVKLDKVDDLEPLRPQIEALPLGLNMQNDKREDFRNLVGAKSGLQAELTGATATESALTQAEGIRAAGVSAEIICESLLREHVETMHLNNLHHLDQDVWVEIAGMDRPIVYNKDSLPINVGFSIRLTTDKNYRPERVQKIISALQFITSLRNDLGNINAVRPLVEELFREFDIDPRLLAQPLPINEQIMKNFKRANSSIPNELSGEIASALQPQSNNVASVKTAVGPVPTSPLNLSVAA